MVSFVHQVLVQPRFSIIRKMWDFPASVLPQSQKLRIVRMKRKIAIYYPNLGSPLIKNFHNHAPVELALAGTRFVNRAPDTCSIRSEKTAGRRVLIRKCGVEKNFPFIFIDFGDKWCAGRNRFAGKFKRTDLLFDCNIVAHVHATGSALAAGKYHQNSTNSENFCYEMKCT